MKNTIIAIVCLITLSVTTASAQAPDPEYLKMLKHQSEYLKMSTKINEKKIRLFEMESDLVKKGKKSESTMSTAQNSADENVNAADELSANAGNEKNAKKAKRSANDAKHDSNKASDAIDDVRDLTKEISELKKEIAEEQSEIILIPGYPFKD